MLSATILVIFLVTLGCVENTTRIPETTNSLLSMINSTLTWNEASIECQTRGGRLLNIFDEVRKIATGFYVKYLIESGVLSSDFWIGLHAISDTGPFKWSDCSAVTTSYWSNVTNPNNDLCVGANKDDLSWNVRPCSDQLAVLCETSRPCSCEMLSNSSECANLTTTISTEFYGLSEEACKIKCLMHVRSNEQCWALSYRKSSSTCIIHERLRTTLNCSSDLTFYPKVCFAYTSPLSRINVTYINNSDSPETTCDGDVFIEPADDCNFTLPTTEAPCTCCSSQTSGLPNFWKNSSLEEQIDWLVTSIKVDKYNTSIMRRRKFSAMDSRLTATSIGYAGAAILILIVSGIVVLDLNRLWNDVKRALRGLFIKK